MRAVVVDRVGPGAVARLAEVPVPVPGPEEVLVRMQYASLNPADWKCRDGWMLRFPQFRPASPFVLGFDGVGVVAATGPGVTDRFPGQRVCVRANQMTGQNGTFAETVCVRRTDSAPVAEGIPGARAATVPIAGVTAWQAVTRFGQVTAGQTVLVNGAAGGVGSFAVQFVRHRGARVAGTASAHNADYLRELGCEQVIDYRAQDVADAALAWSPGGVDVVIDAVHVDGIPGAEQIVGGPGRTGGPGGIVVGIGTLGAAQPYAGRADLRFVEATVDRERAGADIATIATLLADGSVRPPAIEVVSLADVPTALDRVAAGHVRGKIVVAID